MILKLNNLREKDKADVVIYMRKYLKIKCLFDPYVKYKHKSNQLIDKLQQ